MMNLGSKQTYRLLVLIFVVTIVIFANQLASFSGFRVDFTEEKRYTLHPSVSSVLEDLSGTVTIEVFLEGELPSNFKRLRDGIENALQQFARVGGANVEYKFTDPSQASSAQARNQFFRSLIDRGIQPSNVNYTQDGQRIEKLIFPGAIITYNGRERGVTLLKGNRSTSIEEMLNQSIEGLEYELANSIKQLQNTSKPRVGLITGHNEPDSSELSGFTNVILENYDLFRINLPERRSRLTGYDAIIIAKPAIRFSELEKYYIDQFVMNGGKLMVFYDALSVDMSQAHGEGTVAIPVETNLEDLFFRYGIRMNRDYIADVNCGNTPVVTGTVGDQPRIELLPWPYFPVISNYGDHPLVRNLDASWFRGVSSIDTVRADGIRKTPLMFTSEYTLKFDPPVRISYNDLDQKLQPEFFTHGVIPVGYLLEGSFTSLYKNRFPPEGADRDSFIEEGSDNKIIVVADGDFIRNDFSLETENPLPMGVDPYSQTTYANGEFVEKALDYLMDDDQLLLARNREIRIRPLDKAKVELEGETWRWVNVAVPLIFIVLLAFVKLYFRKTQYGN